MSSGGRTTVESMLPEQKFKKSGWVYSLYVSISSSGQGKTGYTRTKITGNKL